MRTQQWLALVALAILTRPAPTRAQSVPGPASSQPTPAQAQPAAAPITIDIDVVAKKLDEARQQIQPSLGASSYNFSPQSLQTIPQGGNASLSNVLLQAPSVAQDSFGQI